MSSTHTAAYIDANEFRIGDTLDVIGRRETIQAVEPYVGTLFTPEQARIATFASGRRMTLTGLMRAPLSRLGA